MHINYKYQKVILKKIWDSLVLEIYSLLWIVKQATFVQKFVWQVIKKN